MITLHRLGQAEASLVLNCDLVATVEANPDTVITLVTGARLVVSESPDEVVSAVMSWRADIGRHTFGVPKVVEPEPYDAPPSGDPPPGGLHTV